MTTSPKSKKAPVISIKAPKIVSAWKNVCTVSNKSENEIVKAIENLGAVMVLESRLSVTQQKAFIKGLESAGTVSSFIKSSHAPALPTWGKLRALHTEFRALPIAKQLSTASASYDLLGSGNGEQIKASKNEQGEIVTALDNLNKAIAGARKAKQTPAPAKASTPKVKKDIMKDILAFFTSLDIYTLSDSEKDTLSEISVIVESLTVSA